MKQAKALKAKKDRKVLKRLKVKMPKRHLKRQRLLPNLLKAPKSTQKRNLKLSHRKPRPQKLRKQQKLRLKKNQKPLQKNLKLKRQRKNRKKTRNSPVLFLFHKPAFISKAGFFYFFLTEGSKEDTLISRRSGAARIPESTGATRAEPESPTCPEDSSCNVRAMKCCTATHGSRNSILMSPIRTGIHNSTVGDKKRHLQERKGDQDGNECVQSD